MVKYLEVNEKYIDDELNSKNFEFNQKTKEITHPEFGYLFSFIKHPSEQKWLLKIKDEELSKVSESETAALLTTDEVLELGYN